MRRRKPGQRGRAEAQVARPELAEVAGTGTVVRAVPAVGDAGADDLAGIALVSFRTDDAAPCADPKVERVCRSDKRVFVELPGHTSVCRKGRAERMCRPASQGGAVSPRKRQTWRRCGRRRPR